jgi:hypothetical protein
MHGRPSRGHLEFDANQTKLLDGAGAADSPVTDERGGLPVEPRIGSLTHLQADGEHSVKLTNR